MNDYFMWYKSVGTSFYHFVTNNVFDRQADGWTAFSWLYHALHYM